MKNRWTIYVIPVLSVQCEDTYDTTKNILRIQLYRVAIFPVNELYVHPIIHSEVVSYWEMHLKYWTIIRELILERKVFDWFGINMITITLSSHMLLLLLKLMKMLNFSKITQWLMIRISNILTLNDFFWLDERVSLNFSKGLFGEVQLT